MGRDAIPRGRVYKIAAAIRTKVERLLSNLYSSGMDGFRAHELLLVPGCLHLFALTSTLSLE